MFISSLVAGANKTLIRTLQANGRAQDPEPMDYLVEMIKRLPHDATPVQAAALTSARSATVRRAGAEAHQAASSRAFPSDWRD